MDLLPSTDQQQILDTIRSFLTAEAPVDRLREFGAIGNPDAAILPKLGELGFLGLALPERDGGIGLGSADEMLVFREFGRHLLSISVFGVVLGARVAAATGDALLCNAMINATTRVGILNPRGSLALNATSGSGDVHLFEATEAEWVLALDADGAALFRRSDFTQVELMPATDSVLTLERARLDGVKPAYWVGADRDPIYRRALLLLAAYIAGMSEGARDMAVDYAKVREQFGKPIGSFQAIKHICANMAIRSEAAYCQVSFAALVFDEQRDDNEFHVIASKIVATDSALQNSADNIQVHGAFGFTSEANAHHYLKRAHVADLLWGDLKTQRSRLLDLPTPA